MWRDGIVPFWIRGMGAEIDLLHFVVSDLHTGLVVSRVQLGLNSKTGRSTGGANEIDDCFIADERLALPVQTDEREHSVLDLVPLTGAWWIMTHGDDQAGLIRQLLQVIFPSTIPAAITSPAVGAQQ